MKGALDKFPELKDLGLVDLNKAVGTSKIPSDLATVIRCIILHITTPMGVLCVLSLSACEASMGYFAQSGIKLAQMQHARGIIQLF